jgi:transposase-like protein
MTGYAHVVSTGGRPSKLTPEVRERVVRAIERGALLETAAAAAGVHRDTLHHWLRRGARESRGTYREFSDAVLRATAELEEKMAGVVTTAALGGDLDAAKWWLERRNPTRWGVRTTLTVRAELTAFLDRLQAQLPEALFGQVLAITLDEPVMRQFQLDHS